MIIRYFVTFTFAEMLRTPGHTKQVFEPAENKEKQSRFNHHPEDAIEEETGKNYR